MSTATEGPRGGTLRRYRRYPEYRDSGVEWLGEIPAHWEVKRLKRVVQFQGGGTPTKDNLEYWRGEIPWVSPKDMKVSVIVDTEDRITPDAIRGSATKLIPSGAVLIVVRSGILVHSIPVAIAGCDVTLNQDLKAMIPGSELAPEYLAYLITGLQRELLIEWKKEGATVESLEVESVACSPTLLPAITEQRAIATFLDRETARIDALVAKNERLIELLQEQRTALISRAVTKGLDPNVPMKDSSVEWLGEIPAHWEVNRIKDTTRKIGSGKTPLGGGEVYVAQGVMLLRSQNVHFGALRLDDVAFIDDETDREMSGSRVQEGDVLLNITGASLGRCCVAHLEGTAANVNQHVCILRPRGDMVDSEFLAAALASHAGQAQIFTAENGISRDALNFDQIGRIVVSAPSLAEQRLIVASMSGATARIDALVAKVRAAIDRLRELRTALISAAVTGKIDVREEAA